MEHGNRVWRYPIPPGADDDPARAEFVSEAQARLRIDPHAYYSMLAQRGNAARWHNQDAAPQDVEHGARADAAPPQASQAAARITQAEAAPAETVAEAGQAQAIAGAALATSQSVTGARAPQAIATGVHRPGELPAHLL